MKLISSRKPVKTTILLGGLFGLIGLVIWSYTWLFAGLPRLNDLQSRMPAASIRITDRNGRLLYEMLPDGNRHTPVSLKHIPVYLRQATISTEDTSFYTNPGVDIKGILRAFWINLRGGETLSGGSTITQQLARNLLMDPSERNQRSLRRKLRETILAWKLSRQYTKDQILTYYLNQTYYGAFSYGVEAASQTFFAKPVSELDLAESALLAGLPQSPGIYNPYSNPEAAKNRQLVVLELMEKHGMITAEERLLAAREQLGYAATPYPMEAPHFVLMIRAELDGILPILSMRNHASFVVRTTLDLDWQHHAVEIIRKQLDDLNHPFDGSLSHNVNNAALVALDPLTGEILALVGNPDYNDTAHNGAINMALAPCQPGSALKPLIYAVAFDPKQRQPWTAATMILDVRTSFLTHDNQPYSPINYDRQEHGPVSARQALASSLNIPAVITLNHISMEEAIRFVNKLGVTTLQDAEQYDLSLALGGGAVRLLDLTAAYGAFANTGVKVTPVGIIEISDADGNILYTPDKPAQPRVMDERVTWLISDILSDDYARSIGFGLHSALNLDRPAAAKTGTTTNFHDNWTIGYTPDLVVGVWVGNANYQPMRDVTGLSGAGPIWHQFMRTILTGKPELQFQRPEGLVQVEVCALSGLLPTVDCPYKRLEWFILGTQPLQVDHIYHTVLIDSLTGQLANPTTPPGRKEKRLALDLPSQAQPWAHQQGMVLLSDLTDSSILVGSSVNTPPVLRLISPNPNAVFRIASDAPLATQRVRLEAVGEAGLSKVTFFIDGTAIKTVFAPPYQAWWVLSPGSHRVWAEATRLSGESIASEIIQFTVR